MVVMVEFPAVVAGVVAVVQTLVVAVQVMGEPVEGVL
jgi:hypothetical protein